MSGLQELVSSAFGDNACLYRDVLKCATKATSSELRKAYHKRALLYHPDKQQKDSSESRVQEAKLKFQALSATYKVLSIPSQRALYDSTGRFPTSANDGCGDPSGASSTAHNSNRKRAQQNKNTDEWVRFYQSVFQDMMDAGSNFDRNEYCGSKQEQEDVKKYYQLCKGNRSKMMSCIVQAEGDDFDRWWKSIIKPSIEMGDIESFEYASSIDKDEEVQKKKPKRLVRKRKLSETKKVPRQQVKDSSAVDGGDLEDTDDEQEGFAKSSSIQKSKTMSRREKMEYRVAKKRKEKREREIEIAGIMQSKNWAYGKAAAAKQGRAKSRNKHGLGESFLSGLQTKFSSTESVPSRKKTKRINRK
ncbi:MAG: hypothetical protein SGBAC_013143 [Bacillariaceae sp.]